jgi:hypothetical protein
MPGPAMVLTNPIHSATGCLPRVKVDRARI